MLQLNRNRLHRRTEKLIEIGERISGTKEIEEAARYIVDELNQYNPEILKFRLLTSRIGSPCIFLVDKVRFDCLTDFFSKSGEFEGELIYTNDFSDIDGKIVLTDLSKPPSRPLKAKIASDAGAKGIVFIGYGTDDNDLIYRGGIKYVWGNPTIFNYRDIPSIASISISRKKGVEIIRKMRKGTSGFISVRTSREWVTSATPIIRKVRSGRRFVIVQSALESIGSTATFNSASNAALMEIVETTDDILAIFTDGHEVAESASSAFLVDSEWEMLKNNAIVTVNVESLGIRGGERSVSYISPEILDYAKKVEKEHGFNSEFRYEGKHGENSYIGIGIPYYWHVDYIPGDLPLGYWYRTEADTIEHVDFVLLEKQTLLIRDLIREMANSKIVPYSLTAFPTLIDNILQNDLINFLNKHNVIDKSVWDKLNVVLTNLHKLKPMSEQLSNELNLLSDISIEEANRLLIKAVRLTHWYLFSLQDKYFQDPYGSNYDEIFPIIRVILNTNDINLSVNSILKEMNKILDITDDLKSILERMESLLSAH
ncbi:hypothetical protein HS7_14860 [Sulfolobales archaeon HS-7]|nr:hypothetical protein HS7_14860 [Sulfolobales archaeon HS-7]